MTDKGYQAALEQLSYELLTRVEAIHTAMLITGDDTRWKALTSESGTEDPEYGEAFLELDNIMWEVSETYNVPMEKMLKDLDVVQKRMLAERNIRVINDSLWNDIK